MKQHWRKKQVENISPLCYCLSFLSSLTDRSFLWRCGPLSDARTLQQLNLHSPSVFPLPVCVWARQQQPHRSSTEGHLCGRTRPAHFRFWDIFITRFNVMENSHLWLLSCFCSRPLPTSSAWPGGRPQWRGETLFTANQMTPRAWGGF